MNRLSTHLPTSDVPRMVAFYTALGFSQVGGLAVRDGLTVFARMALGDSQLRIEHWRFADWAPFREGFAVTTLWIDTESIDVVAASLKQAGIPYEGPSVEDYGSADIELFDPEGFRIIFAESRPPGAPVSGQPNR